MSTRWSKPTLREVELALASIPDLSLRGMFFSELENPEWLAPLRKLGVFKSTPEVWTDPDGSQRAFPWPEGDYLVRIAPDRPDEVTTLLNKIGRSDNPWVQRAVISAATRLPTMSVAKLVPVIARAVTESSGFIDAPQVMAVAERLGAENYIRPMRGLLEALFEPQGGPDRGASGRLRPRVHGSVDDYFYAELLPRAVPLLVSMGDDGVRLVTRWLTRASSIQADGLEDSYDASSIWRPSIAPHQQNSGLHEVWDALISAVRDVGSGVCESGISADVIQFLNKSRLPLIRRIALEVASKALASDRSEEAITAGYGLLIDQSLMKISSRPEYVHLAVALLPLLGNEQREAWVKVVLDQQWQGTEEDIRRITSWRSGEAVTVDEMAETRRRMLHTFLQPIGPALPDVLAQELAGMVAEYGEVDHPEFGTHTGAMFAGPVSPLKQTDMAEMTPEGLSEYLRTWKPSSDSVIGPSIEGLARELEVVAEAKPELVEGLADDLMALGRSYVRSALSGLSKALAGGYEPGERVWSLVSRLVRMADDGVDPTPNLDADDRVWRYAQRSAIDLIVAHINAHKKPIRSAEVDRLWALLKPLTAHADPTPAHEERYGGSNMDPLTLSLNTTRPVAIRAAISLLVASHARKRPGSPTAAQKRILETLGEHVGASQDPSLAVAATFGEGIGRLWTADPAWVSAHEKDLFAILDDDEQVRAWADVVVSVALRVYNTGTGFLKLIRPALERMLTRRYEETMHSEGWRDRKSAAQAAALHVLNGYLIEIIDRDDPLMGQLFSEVSNEVVADALGHIGWQIMRTGSGDENGGNRPPDKYLARAKGLINWRVGQIRSGKASAAELAQFYWWAQAELFDPAWWLPVLLLATDGFDMESRGVLGGPLAKGVLSQPALAMEAFERLYGARGEDWRGYDLLQHAPAVLAGALTSGNPNAIKRARDMHDLLGRQGHFGTLKELGNLLTDEA